jgi:hypothetical protein
MNYLIHNQNETQDPKIPVGIASRLFRQLKNRPYLGNSLIFQ